MDERLLSRDLFKNYSRYCYPILFSILVLIIVVIVSFCNLSTGLISPDTNIEDASNKKYSLVGIQALNFSTFILTCILPIGLALVMASYERTDKHTISEHSITNKEVFSSKIISGALFIILPFLANVIIYMVLIISGYFGTAENNMLAHLIELTIFGIVMSLLTFMLITIINLSIKNPVIDSLITLSIALIVTVIFYNNAIPIHLLIAIIFFVWLALVYLGYSMNKQIKKSH